MDNSLNGKIKRLIQPNMRLYYIFLIVFTIATLLVGEYKVILFAVEATVIVLLYAYSTAANKKRSSEILNYLEEAVIEENTSDVELKIINYRKAKTL